MLVRTESFLRPNSKSLIFFLAPYATPIEKLKPAIKTLNRSGFSVIAYEYSLDIFRTGETDNLFSAIDESREHIQNSVNEFREKGYTEFGFVGSSMGAFVSYNCLRAIPELEWGIMITGGSVVEAIWSFQTERESFQTKGYTKQKLEEVWHDLEFADLGDLHGHRYVLIASKGDSTTPYKYAQRAFNRIEAAGAEVNLIVHRRLNHRQTIIRNLLRINSLVRKVHR